LDVVALALDAAAFDMDVDLFGPGCVRTGADGVPEKNNAALSHGMHGETFKYEGSSSQPRASGRTSASQDRCQRQCHAIDMRPGAGAVNWRAPYENAKFLPLGPRLSVAVESDCPQRDSKLLICVRKSLAPSAPHFLALIRRRLWPLCHVAPSTLS
jgi:hypothetical protein